MNCIIMNLYMYTKHIIKKSNVKKKLFHGSSVVYRRTVQLRSGMGLRYYIFLPTYPIVRTSNQQFIRDGPIKVGVGHQDS